MGVGDDVSAGLHVLVLDIWSAGLHALALTFGRSFQVHSGRGGLFSEHGFRF